MISEPKSYTFAAWLFLRLLGLIYLTAFLSLAAQIRGLAGVEGILPASEVIASRNRRNINRFWRLPTLCWLSTSDEFLLFLCWGGAVLAALFLAGLAPLLLLILLWVFYLSLFNVCRLFLGYQWDVLLLECGFLAIFLAPARLWPGFLSLYAPSPIIVWLFWWLLFRLMFSSGFAKVRSGDKTWRNLTAICFHYETQPLPTPLAWYASHLPCWFHRISAAMVLLIEVLGPTLMFGPLRARYVACGAFIALMVLIEVTGNYAFFNLLGVALSLLLLDDDFWNHALGSAFLHRFNQRPNVSLDPLLIAIDVVVALVLLFLSWDAIGKMLRYRWPWPKPLLKCLAWLAPFRLVSSYGLFAVMTTKRPEIIVEGSDDGVTWRAYEFKHKPGSINRAPRVVAPFQPRLDWQLWFAALGSCDENPWFMRFLTRLFEGSKPVIDLLRTSPFPQKPPRYLRAGLYDYQFTKPAQRALTGDWWKRQPRRQYCPVLKRIEVGNARISGV